MMNYKLVAAVAFVLLVGLLAWSFFRPSEAQGQAGQTKGQWEYKVVAFVVEDESRDQSRDVQGQTKQINSLAAEGWEYVGLLCAGSNSADGRVDQVGGNVQLRMKLGGNVLFKRPKR